MSFVQEHESALKFFQRALQLDPTFTYAYTLSGHEYFANEDFEKVCSYRKGTVPCIAVTSCPHARFDKKNGFWLLVGS